MQRSAKISRRLVALLAGLVLIVVGFGLWPRRSQTAPVFAEPVATARETKIPLPGVAENVAPGKAPEKIAAEWHGPQKREGIDAANIYAEAFVLFDQLTDEEKTMLRKPGDEVDAEKAAQLFAKIQAIMALLHAAAKADYCDWGTGEINFDTGLPHVSKAQDLGQLALWAAAYRFATDDPGAIDDLSARARLAHHLTDTLIGVLVSANFERTANDLVRGQMGSFDAATMSKSLDFIGSSTVDDDLSRAFRGETSGVESFGKKLVGLNPVERGKMLQEFTAQAPEWADSVKQFATGFFADPERIADEVAFIRGIHEKAADAMRTSDANFRAWWDEVQRTLNENHPLAQVALPSLSSIQSNVQKLRVERALITAGADVLQNGPARLGSYRDPATGGAFLYVPTPGGFDLRSTYQVKGKPLSLSFPQPK